MTQFLVRFDDIHPKMNWENWYEIEKILLAENISPILAVIPDNQDRKLNVGNRDEQEFWNYIRECDRRGWTIAIHGYQHIYETDQNGIFGTNNKSEFAGLDSGFQQQKIQSSIEKFTTENIKSDVFVAPSHSFDTNTLKILRENGILYISDGFYTRIVQRLGQKFIPQQLWRFRNIPFGTWTVCMHSDTMTFSDIKCFERDIKRFRTQILSFNEAISQNDIPTANIFDDVFSYLFRLLVFIKKRL
jgi:predicted deacetylase